MTKTRVARTYQLPKEIFDRLKELARQEQKKYKQRQRETTVEAKKNKEEKPTQLKLLVEALELLFEKKGLEY